MATCNWSGWTYWWYDASYYLTAIFVVAAVTDWFDGYLARTLNQTSAFGRFLDPVADKLMVAAALIVLVQWQPSITMAFAAIVIISREITSFQHYVNGWLN